jgi:hypothetical protein
MRLPSHARLEQGGERHRITYHGHMPHARNDFNAHILFYRRKRRLVFVRDINLVVFADQYRDRCVTAAKVSEVITIRAEVGKEAVGLDSRTLRIFRKSECNYWQT